MDFINSLSKEILSVIVLFGLLLMMFGLYIIPYNMEEDKYKQLVKKTTQDLNEIMRGLDAKWNAEIDEMVRDPFERMENKIAKLQDENDKLRLMVAKQDEEIALTKCQMEKYIDAMFVNLDGELTNKMGQIETKLDDINVIVRNKTRNLDEKMFVLEEQMETNTRVILDNVETSSRKFESLETKCKNVMENMDILQMKLQIKYTSLKTEFDERNVVVAIGVYGYSDNRPVIINSNTSDLINAFAGNYNKMAFDLHSLKFLPKLLKIDLQRLYHCVSELYVIDRTNILDEPQQPNNWTCYSTIRDIRDIPLLFQMQGSKKVIEYIRSIRPDIVLTWNETPI